jgi:hypothetical protein
MDAFRCSESACMFVLCPLEKIEYENNSTSEQQEEPCDAEIYCAVIYVWLSLKEDTWAQMACLHPSSNHDTNASALRQKILDHHFACPCPGSGQLKNANGDPICLLCWLDKKCQENMSCDYTMCFSPVSGNSGKQKHGITSHVSSVPLRIHRHEEGWTGI